MRILVTGATGFMGSHLVDYLLEHDMGTVQILKRWRSDGRMNNLEHLEPGRIKVYEGDLTDPYSLAEVLKRAQPDQIYHVAAHTHVPYSYTSPLATLDTNLQGTIHLLETCRTYVPHCKILIVSSGEVYGSHDDTITEESALNVRSPYGLGKLAEDRAAYMYQQAYGMNILIARSFSQVGPRKYVGLVDSAWCYQLAKMERGLQKEILQVGRLDTIRTFCDCLDMVKAYVMFMEDGQAGELYNICGDDVLKMEDIITFLRRLTQMQFQVREDPFLMRPTDVLALKPSSEKFRQRFGWQPETAYVASLERLLNYWRERV